MNRCTIGTCSSRSSRSRRHDQVCASAKRSNSPSHPRPRPRLLPRSFSSLRPSSAIVQIQSASPRLALHLLPRLRPHPSHHRVFSSSVLPFSQSSASVQDPDEPESESQRVRRTWASLLTSRRSRLSSGASAGGGGGVRGSLPKDVFDVSFSRSQGPGGQNVNKVNTKANVRLLLSQASSLTIFDSGKSIVPVPIPKEVVSRLVEKSAYYTHATHSLLISSESLRTQEGNLSQAVEKLLDHLHQHATAGLINPTSAEQKDKVARLISREKGKLKKVKSQRSAVKSGRRDKGF